MFEIFDHTKLALTGGRFYFDDKPISIRALSRRLGYEHNLISKRLQKGETDIKKLIAPPYGARPTGPDARLYTYAGKTQTLTAWAEDLNTTRCVLWWRLMRGWPLKDVFTAPVAKREKCGQPENRQSHERGGVGSENPAVGRAGAPAAREVGAK
jgi:hypothetical protein